MGDDAEAENSREGGRSERSRTDPPVEDDESQPETETPAEKYPYFVRRSNVTDERDQRIEVHLRREISSEESAFRSQLDEHLDTDEVSKTDAREFALKYAFQNPEGIAELMREEGVGVFD